MKRNPLIAFVFVAALVFCSVANARENPYDALGKMFEPWAALFSSEAGSPVRAIRGELVLNAMTGLRADLAGSSVSFAIEKPDKFFLRAPLIGEQVAICRDGQNAWAAPGKIFGDAIAEIPNLPKFDPTQKLGSFALPIPEKQLVFLPALFQVNDQGDFALNGETCRVIDFSFTPALAKSLRVEKWKARVWLRDGHKPARLELAQPGWHIVLDFKNLQYAGSLPPETWQPPADADVLQLDAPHVAQLLDFVAHAALSEKSGGQPEKKRSKKKSP